ncbi:MAG TPA: nucleoside deaminase [Candidatus Limnocylindrales bacterium]
MTPEELMAQAILIAEEGMDAAGELPIGAVVASGDRIVARAYTQERTQKRRLVHAELLALIDADRRLKDLRLATTVEPCPMCFGAALNLGVKEVYFGVSSPTDGVLQAFAELPFYKPPVIVGGVLEQQCRELFERYCRTAPEGGLKDWALTML